MSCSIKHCPTHTLCYALSVVPCPFSFFTAFTFVKRAKANTPDFTHAFILWICPFFDCFDILFFFWVGHNLMNAKRGRVREKSPKLF